MNRVAATKLNLDDLLAPLASSSNLQSLKKSVKVLTSSSTKIQTLATPLPQRTQEKLDREAAYEQTREEIDKWSATMKRIKEVHIRICRHHSLGIEVRAFVRRSTSAFHFKLRRKGTPQISSSLQSSRYL